MKTNLQWIEQEWRRYCTTTEGQRALVDPMIDLAGVAKLFAAFCLDRLRMESEAVDSIG